MLKNYMLKPPQLTKSADTYITWCKLVSSQTNQLRREIADRRPGLLLYLLCSRQFRWIESQELPRFIPPLRHQIRQKLSKY